MQDQRVDRLAGRQAGAIRDQRFADIPGGRGRSSREELSESSVFVSEIEDTKRVRDQVIGDERVAHVRLRQVIGIRPGLTDHPRHDARSRGSGVDIEPIARRSGGSQLTDGEGPGADRGHRGRRQDIDPLHAHTGRDTGHRSPRDIGGTSRRAHLGGHQGGATAEQGVAEGCAIGCVAKRQGVETIRAAGALGAEIAATEIRGGEITAQESARSSQEALAHAARGVTADIAGTGIEIETHDGLDTSRRLITSIPKPERTRLGVPITRHGARHCAGRGIKVNRDGVVDLVDAAAAGIGLVKVERTVAVDDDVRQVARRQRRIELTVRGRKEDRPAVDDQVAEAGVDVTDCQRGVTDDPDRAETGEFTAEGRCRSLVDVERRADAKVNVSVIGVGLTIASGKIAHGL